MEPVGITSAGKLHEVEPSADSLSFIDFEDCGFDWDTFERRAWMQQSADAVATEITTNRADWANVSDAFRGIMNTLGESAAWHYIGNVAMAQGFDVYDSDGRFEVFEGGTPEYEEGE
jgi:hypothetical protein